MTSVRNHWKNYVARRDASICEAQERGMLQRISNSVNDFRNKEDIAWLETLLENYGDVLSAVCKDKMLDSLAWLKEVPTRTLGGYKPGQFNWRRYYESIERLLHEGKYEGDEFKIEESNRKVRSKRTLRALRRDETRPKRPDWMDDKSRLPMKPPGR